MPQTVRSKKTRAVTENTCLAMTFCVALGACSSTDDSAQPADEPAAPDEPIISRDNHAELIHHIFDLYVGDRYNKPYLGILDLVSSTTLLSSERPAGDVLQSYSCDSGTIDQTLVVSSTNAGNFYTNNFSNCLHSGVVYDGEISGQDGSFRFTFGSDAFTTQTGADLLSSFSGSGEFQFSESTLGPRHIWEATNLALTSRSIDGNLELTAPLTRFEYSTVGGRDRALLEGDLIVRSDISSGHLINASTPISFEYFINLQDVPRISQEERNAWNFTVGQLQLTAEDGSSLLLDANTGDDATVSITIDNTTGSETFTSPWSLWQQALRFDRYPRESLDWTSPGSVANPDPADGPGITIENYRVLLDHAFEVYAGKYVNTPVNTAVDVLLSAPVQEQNTEQGLITETRTCYPEGTARTTRVDTTTTTAPADFKIEFDSCDEAEFQFDGSASGTVAQTGNSFTNLESEWLEWLDGEGIEYRMSGRTERAQFVRDGLDVCQWHEKFVNLQHSPADGNDILLANFGSTFEILNPENPTILIDGAFTIVSPATRGHALFANASELTSKQSGSGGELLFTKGELSLSTSDGSRMSFSANENTDTLIEIDNSLGHFDIREPWGSFRSLLPEIINDLCHSEQQ